MRASTPPARWCCLLALALALACAHAPPPPAQPVAYPPAPARSIVRWVGSFPDARRQPERPSVLSRLGRFLLGTEEAPSRAEAVLERPFGLAATESGFAVADPDGRRVLRVDWSSGQALPVSCPGKEWQMPIAVAAAPGGELFIADAGAGTVVRVHGGECTAIGVGLFERPSGLAFSSGRVYVADPPRHVVVALSPAGEEQLRFGSHGEGGGQLNFPTNVTALADGTLLVVDALNFRIARYTADGRFLSAFGEPGDGGGAFGRPRAVAVDPRGRTYVSDAQNDAVVVFSPGGRFEFAIGEASEGPAALTLPAGLAIGGGFLYVADSYGHRVQVYRLVGGAEP